MTGELTALAGLRVLDLANEFGLYCGKLLAGLGAELIKVEAPGGDKTRGFGPFFHEEPHIEKSLYFAYNNTGKKSITLNLNTKDGQDIFRKLAKNSDVVVETFTPGYVQNLGIEYLALKELNPRLVMTSITPFGQSGSRKHYQASSEIIPLAMGGLMFMTGEPSTPPLQVGNLLVGSAVGIYAAIGTLAGIHNRSFTGQGEHVDISMQECIASWLEASYARYQYTSGEITTRYGSHLPLGVPVGVYPCKDGHFCIHGIGRWNLIVAWLLSEEIDVGDLIDPKYELRSSRDMLEARNRVDKVLCELGAKHTKMELMNEGQRRGIPVTIVGNAENVYEDEHLLARGYFVKLKHPILGELDYAGAPYKMGASPWQIGGPAPLLGEHNAEIYGALGFSEEDLATLKATGVI